MTTVTKKELIDRIAERTKIKRNDVKRIVQEFLDEVVAELKRGNRLEFRDFGVFEIKNRAARTAQNPKTLEPVEVPAKRTVKFKVGRLMRASLDPQADDTAAPVTRKLRHKAPPPTEADAALNNGTPPANMSELANHHARTGR